MSINELFGGNDHASSNNTRTLSGTQELTRLAGAIANRMLKAMSDNVEEYRSRIAESATDNDTLNALINEFKPFTEADDSTLATLDEATVAGMLKSQQSKRSRARGNLMTMDNYKTLLTAAIAEALIRELCLVPKGTRGGRRRGTVDFTPAELETLAADQEALRREIRNVQSKKSIYKGRADFDATSEYWQSLLRSEAMLKDLRVDYTSSAPKVVEVDHTKDKLKALLDNVDPEHLKAADSKQLLASISELLAADTNTSDEG